MKAKPIESKTRKNEKDDNFRTMKEKVKQIMGRKHPVILTYDGKPLNYSFKKIRHLDEVLNIVPKEGVRKEKPHVVYEEFIKE